MSPSTTPPVSRSRSGFVLELLARSAQVDPLRLARLVGPTDSLTVIDTLVAQGIVDRVAARALSLAVDGQLDERDLRQLIDINAVRASVNRASSPQLGRPLPLPLHATLGRYTVGGVLGRGRCGDVYRSVHPQLKTPVALKVSSDGAALRAEAIALASVVHPNVVRLWDLDQVGDLTVLVTQAGGKSLARVLRRRGVLAPRTAFRLARGILAGLVAVHRAGFVHGDVKPANILVGQGPPLLCDFGSARRIGGVVSNRVEGTWLYTAPECFDGRISPKSDVYSLGLALYQVLTGQAPIAVTDFEACRAAHSNLRLDPLHWSVPGVKRSAWNLVRNMTNRDEQSRPSAREALAAARNAFELDDIIEN